MHSQDAYGVPVNDVIDAVRESPESSPADVEMDHLIELRVFLDSPEDPFSFLRNSTPSPSRRSSYHRAASVSSSSASAVRARFIA
jgi:hypothetical protein